VRDAALTQNQARDAMIAVETTRSTDACAASLFDAVTRQAANAPKSRRRRYIRSGHLAPIAMTFKQDKQ
jgi:hypothetical protein